jgi:hypothetical protein
MWGAAYAESGGAVANDCRPADRPEAQGVVAGDAGGQDQMEPSDAVIVGHVGDLLIRWPKTMGGGR